MTCTIKWVSNLAVCFVFGMDKRPKGKLKIQFLDITSWKQRMGKYGDELIKETAIHYFTFIPRKK